MTAWNLTAFSARNSAEALRNVVLTTAASERDAANAVFNCWLEGLTMISDVPLAERQQACVNGDSNVKGVGPVHSLLSLATMCLLANPQSLQSALEDIEEAYISRVNQ